MMQISEGDLDKAVAMFAKPTHAGSLWAEMKLMEQGGYDIAVLQPYLSSWLRRGYDSPFIDTSDLTDADEREIVLALRDRLRSELLLPPLSFEAREAWVYAPVKQYAHPIPAGDLSTARQLSDDEIQRVIQAIRSRHPRVAAFAKDAEAHNQRLKAEGVHHESWASIHWLNDTIEREICDSLKLSGRVYSLPASIDIRDAFYFV